MGQGFKYEIEPSEPVFKNSLIKYSNERQNIEIRLLNLNFGNWTV